jgi:hypothetical protein
VVDAAFAGRIDLGSARGGASQHGAILAEETV